MKEKWTSRSAMLEEVGATCTNVNQAWFFVNHDTKSVYTGAWSDERTEDGYCVFSESWRYMNNGYTNPAYNEAKKFISLVQNNGYDFYTFPQMKGTPQASGRASLKWCKPIYTRCELKVSGSSLVAVPLFFDENTSEQISVDLEDILSNTEDPTERITLSLARIGQGKFRRYVASVWGFGMSCALTDCNVESVIVASHIIAWSQCDSNAKRLDPCNGIPLAAHVDKLFERHLLTFEESQGSFHVRFAPNITEAQIVMLGLADVYCLDSSLLSEQHYKQVASYLKSHNATFYAMHGL
jgi:hypothetical protein